MISALAVRAAFGFAAVTMACASLSIRCARAEDAAQFYKGKTVKYTVSVAVGGGFDAYARLMAPHMGKALDATVIVENQPGAGGMIALNQQMLAPPDGLRFTLINGTPAALAQLLEQENIRYDLTKMDHLGIISADPWVWLMAPGSPVKSVADAQAPGVKIRWGGTGPTGGPSDGAAITCEALRLDCKIVIGYRGSAEIALAMQRGELDALYVSAGSGHTYERSGQARAIAVSSRVRSTLLPQTPTLFEAAKLTPEQEWWLDFRTGINDLGRLMVTSPGVPPERLALLRAAIKQALTNPEVIAEGEKTGRLIDFRDALEASRIAQKVIGQTTAEQKGRVRDVVLKKYY